MIHAVECFPMSTSVHFVQVSLRFFTEPCFLGESVNLGFSSGQLLGYFWPCGLSLQPQSNHRAQVTLLLPQEKASLPPSSLGLAQCGACSREREIRSPLPQGSLLGTAPVPQRRQLKRNLSAPTKQP